MSNKIRKIFSEKLPRYVNGTYKGKIKWNECEGYFVHFIYDDIEGYMKIVNYTKKGQILTIQYKDMEYKIKTNNFLNVKLGSILEKITGDFKIKINTRYNDNKRNITIVDMKKEKDGKNNDIKWYKYHCNKCGYENWITEYSLLDGTGCSACCKFNCKPVLGINTIWDTDTWMIPFIGEECAKTHTHGSTDKIYPTCPDCGNVSDKNVAINKIYTYHSMSCKYCSDGISYPNKFMFNLLKELGVDFISEYSPDWIGLKRYDFYIPSINKIIEMDGKLGHGNETYNNNIQTAEESKIIDDYKDKLAKDHSISVIRIDCNYGHNNRFEYIKNKILKSDIAKLLDLTHINLSKCDESAMSNLIKVACNYKSDNPELTTTEIGKIMGLNGNTICNYLKKGSRLNWCEYDAKQEKSKVSSKSGKSNGKLVEIFRDNISLGIFESISDLSGKSKELFGVKLLSGLISEVCNGKRKHHQGFTFKFI